ncbi:hypothetical protein [Anditalea andensis]|uniref:Transposase n=1 Tax=Anditalea andensis TaxID=1048983 RepID=A0A074KV08_9BACT|nr:hypothetical protein [Anditalea andensis]KEO72734.1 hypothetical protein EL17_18565 [Anditalea andensis]
MKDLNHYSEVTRREIVSEVLSGSMTKEQARRVYGIKCKSAILEWMRMFAGLSRAATIDPIPLLKNMSVENGDIEKLKEKVKQLEEKLALSQRVRHTRSWLMLPKRTMVLTLKKSLVPNS